MHCYTWAIFQVIISIGSQEQTAITNFDCWYFASITIFLLELIEM